MQQLPEDVLVLMQEGKARQIVPFLDWASSQKNAQEFADAVLDEARQRQWSATEVGKLRAYVPYFAKRYQEAYDIAEPFSRKDNFDGDFFGIALMCLFSSRQFDRAYALFKTLGSNEDEMLGSVDFQVAAVLVCWSAGDRYRACWYSDFGMRNAKESGIMVFNALAIYFELGDEEGLARATGVLNDEALAHPNFQYSLGFIELAKNNYEEGLRLTEARYSISEAALHMRIELLERRRWAPGESLQGKTLLIHGEQGLGDMIQTARFFRSCCDQAARVIVECPDESIALLQHNFPEISYVPLRSDQLSQPFDLWVGTLSLPYVYQVTADTIPGKSGYLKVPEDHIDYWHDRISELARPGAAKIGIAWSGYPGHRADHRRSIRWPLIRRLLEQFPEVDFFSVQTFVPEEVPVNLHGFVDEMATLSDTAALINEMDLIISVDTSPVHIAGAIGKETWMLLPYRYEWRWGLKGEENPWYDSVKVIRQPSPGAWAPVLSRVFGPRLRAFLKDRIRQ